MNSPVEVINAGIPGYTTYQELEFLNTYGLAMEPDLVVLCVVFNDVYYKYLHRPEEGDLLAAEPSARLNRFDVQSFPGVLLKNVYLAHSVASTLHKVAVKLGISTFYPFNYRNDLYLAWKDYGWRHSDALIGEMQAQLSARGAPLTIVTFPISDQMDDAYLAQDRDYVLYPQRRVGQIGEKYGIPCVDLTDALYRGGGMDLFSDYVHLKGEGNEIVSVELTRYLSGVLPSFLNE